MTKKTKSEVFQEFEEFGLSEHSTEFHLLEQGYRTAESELLPVVSDLQRENEELKKERDAYYDELSKYRQESARHKALVTGIREAKVYGAIIYWDTEKSEPLVDTYLASDIDKLLEEMG